MSDYTIDGRITAENDTAHAFAEAAAEAESFDAFINNLDPEVEVKVLTRGMERNLLKAQHNVRSLEKDMKRLTGSTDGYKKSLEGLSDAEEHRIQTMGEEIDAEKDRIKHLRLVTSALKTNTRQTREEIKSQRDLVDERHKATVGMAKMKQKYDQLGSSLQRNNKEMKNWITRSDGTRLAGERLRAEMGALEHSIRKAGGNLDGLGDNLEGNDRRLQRWARSLAKLRISAGPFSGTVTTMGKALTVLGPIILDLVGAAGALIGVMGTSLLGAFTVGGAALSGFSLAALGTFLVLKNMPGLAEKASAGWSKLTDRFTAATAGARKPVFSTLNEGLKTANALLPMFASETTKTMKVASTETNKWLKGLRGPEAKGIFSDIMGGFRQGLPALMQGLGSLGAMFGRVFGSAAGFLPELNRGFSTWASNLASSVGSGNALDQKIGRLVDHMQDFGHFTQASGRFLGSFFNAGANAGDDMLKTMTGALNRWTDWTKSAGGQKSLANFFEKSVHGAEELFGVLAPMAASLVHLFTAARPVVHGFEAITGAAASLVSALSAIPGLLESIGAAMALMFVGNRVGRGLGLLTDGATIASLAMGRLRGTSTAAGAAVKATGPAAASAGRGVSLAEVGFASASTEIATTGVVAATTEGGLSALGAGAIGLAGAAALPLAPLAALTVGLTLLAKQDTSTNTLRDYEAFVKTQRAAQAYQRQIADVVAGQEKFGNQALLTDKQLAQQDRDIVKYKEHLAKLAKQAGPLGKLILKQGKLGNITFGDALGQLKELRDFAADFAHSLDKAADSGHGINNAIKPLMNLPRSSPLLDQIQKAGGTPLPKVPQPFGKGLLPSTLPAPKIGPIKAPKVGAIKAPKVPKVPPIHIRAQDNATPTVAKIRSRISTLKDKLVHLKANDAAAPKIASVKGKIAGLKDKLIHMKVRDEGTDQARDNILSVATMTPPTVVIPVKWGSPGPRPGGGFAGGVFGYAMGADAQQRAANRAAEKQSRSVPGGAKISSPTFLTGEEGPAHPEYVIATNPAYRASNERYLESAAGVFGFSLVPAYAKGKHGGKAKPLSSKQASKKKAGLPGGGDYGNLFGTGSDYDTRHEEIDALSNQIDVDKRDWSTFFGQAGGRIPNVDYIVKEYEALIQLYTGPTGLMSILGPLAAMRPVKDNYPIAKGSSKNKKIKKQKKKDKAYNAAAKEYNSSLKDGKDTLAEELAGIPTIVQGLRLDEYDLQHGAEVAAAQQNASFNAVGLDIFRNFTSNISSIAGTSFGGVGSIMSPSSVNYNPVGTTVAAASGSGVGSSQTTPASGVGSGGGNTFINNYASPPPDPFTWTQQQQFEVQAV